MFSHRGERSLILYFNDGTVEPIYLTMASVNVKLTVWVCIAITFFLNSASSAGQIYTWTDKNGTLHLTDTPPPESAQSVDVMHYSPRLDKEQEGVQQIRNYEKYDRILKEAEALADRTGKQAAAAGEKANLAEKAAQEERTKTSELEAQVTKRKKHQLELSRQKDLEARAVEKAAAAQQQALEAEKLYQQAEEQLKTLRQAIDRQRRGK